MGKDTTNFKSVILCAVIAFLHTIVTFMTDKSIFVWPDRASNAYRWAVADYIICKIIVFALLLLIYQGLYILVFTKSEIKQKILEMVKIALPYLLVITVVMIIKLPQGFLTNDENAIYADAISLTHDTWFNYLTTYYYIVSLMILPFKYAPIIFKALLQLLAVAYVVYRIKKYFGTRLGMWGYILFLMYPIIAYTTSAHRLPIYFLMYLMLYAKLLFDGLEGATLNATNGAIILITGAVLTQWRTEGIYMFALIPILCLFVYANIRKVKKFAILIITYVIIQYLFSIPQNGFTANGIDGAANDRMKPFYAYTITNMYRNGLDLDKNAADLAIVDRYLSLDTIVAINEYYGDINYEDVLILYKEGFMGVREDATVEDFINYSDALKRIFVNNPDVFIRTRIGAFIYAALPYHINYSGLSPKAFISFGISIVKSLAYNLFIPLWICALLCIYSLIRRRWYSFFVFGGLLAHWLIVFVLAPASYFKYYFPIYIMSYFYVLVIALWLYRNRKDELKSPVW